MKIHFKNPVVGEILSGISYTVLGSVLSQALIFASSIPVSRILGKTAYGAFGAVQNNVALITLLATALLSITSQKYVAQYRNHGLHHRILVIKKLLSFAAYASFGFLLITWGYYSYYREIFTDTNSFMIVLLSCIIVLANSFNSAQIGILAGLGRFKQVSFVNIFKGTASSVLMIVLVFAYDLTGAVLGLTIASIVACMISSIYIKEQLIGEDNSASVNTSIHFNLKELSSLAIPSILSSIITIPAMVIANTKLTLSDNGLSEMALYNIAFQWRTLILFVPTYINFIFLSYLSTLYYSNLKSFKKLLRSNFLAAFLISAALVLFIYLFGHEIENVYTNEFAGIYQVILLLSLSAFFTVMAAVIGNLFAATGTMWYGFIPNVVWVIVFSYLLVNEPHLNAVSLSVIYLKSYFTLFIIALLMCLKLFFDIRSRKPVCQ